MGVWIILLVAIVAQGASVDALLQQARSARWGKAYAAHAGCSAFVAQGNTPIKALDQWSFRCTFSTRGFGGTEFYYATPHGSLTLQRIAFRLTPEMHLALQHQSRQRKLSTPASELVLADGAELFVIERSRFQLSADDKVIEREIGLQSYERARHFGKDRMLRELSGSAEPRKASELKASVLRLLKDAEHTDRERKALLLVAADELVDQLADKLVGKGGELPEAATARRELEPFGVILTKPTWDGGLGYDMSLLRRAVAEVPETEWGEIAFVRMIARGFNWRPFFGCEPLDQFRVVIQEGEKYLAAYPNTRYRKEILFALALAYETWWSAVKVTPEDGRTFDQFGPMRKRYKARAELARMNAVRYYEQLASLAPDSPEALAAHRHLPRLKRKLDTGQRAFLCTTC